MNTMKQGQNEKKCPEWRRVPAICVGNVVAATVGV